MQRRSFLLTATLPLVAAAGATPGVASLDDALRWLDVVEQATSVRATGAWPAGTVLQHLAQSIEMSMDGYPLPKSPWFQGTVGTTAFAYFKWRGRMSHALDEPIPGAPALPNSTDTAAGAKRLRAAIVRFQAHGGPLHPHFAYGGLSKADYALAHCLHIANHQEEFAG